MNVKHTSGVPFFSSKLAKLSDASRTDPRLKRRRVPKNRLVVPESGCRLSVSLRALKGRPVGDHGSSEDLVNVRNDPAWRLYGPEWPGMAAVSKL